MERTRRLAEAIEAWRSGSIREFQREIAPMLKERGERGGSYAMIHRYLAEGDPQPPTGFLLVAATLLGVRTEWLLEGKGEMTEAEQRARDLQEPPPLTWDKLSGWAHKNLSATALVGDAIVSLVAADPSDVDPSSSQLEALEDGLAFLMALPISFFGGGTEILEERPQYFVAAAHALNLAIPPRGKGQPIDMVILFLQETRESVDAWLEGAYENRMRLLGRTK